MHSGYQSFLLHNAGRVSSVESSLRSLAWFLPGRFQDSEIASELALSVLNVLGLYHDNILLSAVDKLPPSKIPKKSAHARYTQHWTKSNSAYRLLARALAILGYLELAAEMIAKRKFGDKQRWRLVTALETVKMILRLTLLQITRTRSLVTPAIPQREVDPEVLQSLSQSPSRKALSFSTNESDVYNSSLLQGSDAPDQEEGCWVGPRSGIRMQTLASLREQSGEHAPTDINNFLASKVLTPEDVVPPQDLVRHLDGWGLAAEGLWIVRPMIYLLLMKRYGKRHRNPLIASFIIEYLALKLKEAYFKDPDFSLFNQAKPSKSQKMNSLDKAELDDRKGSLWWYLARGAVWDGWTKGAVESIVNKLDGKPILGLGAVILKEYIPLIDEFYYYSS